MRSKQERNQIITSEEKGRLRNHCGAVPLGLQDWGEDEALKGVATLFGSRRAVDKAKRQQGCRTPH